MIWNLLTNAIKFTPAGGKVTVELENTPASVRLIVTDTGKGIPRDFLAHVFEPFRQGDASTTRTHGGLGLGLAIVRHLVEGHGGTVAAFSDGLDAARDSSSSCPRFRSRPTRRSRISFIALRMAGVRVLFVDDQADARELARVIFSNAGAESTITSCASEALEALDRLPIDIVVADIAMPEVDGYALIAEIRRRDAPRNATHPRSPRPRIAATTIAPAHSRRLRRLREEADGRGDADVDRRRRHGRAHALTTRRDSRVRPALPDAGRHSSLAVCVDDER